MIFMPGSVMVTPENLDLVFQVRVLAGQPKISASDRTRSAVNGATKGSANLQD